jgi:hypothetical protein
VTQEEIDMVFVPSGTELHPLNPLGGDGRRLDIMLNKNSWIERFDEFPAW